MTAPRTDAGTREVDHQSLVCVVTETWCLDVRVPGEGLRLERPEVLCAFAGCVPAGGGQVDAGHWMAGADPLPGAVWIGPAATTTHPSAVVPLPGAALFLATAIGVVVVMRRMRR